MIWHTIFYAGRNVTVGPSQLFRVQGIGFALCVIVRSAVIWTVLLLVVPGDAAVSRPQRHPYRQHWKRAMFSKRALAGVGARAGVSHLAHHPSKWGDGASGFAKRAGAGLTTHAVKTTVEHAIAAPLHEDLHYHRSEKRGFGPRLGHALSSTVVTHNTRTGKRTPAVGRLSGHAAAGAFSQAALHAGAGASTAGIGLGAEAGVNVAREFWPRHKGQSARSQRTEKTARQFRGSRARKQAAR
jgi:hypothetical protein